MSVCFHCGLPASAEFSSTINNQTQEFCCPGCRAVAEAIHASGLSHYYLYRDKPGIKPAEVKSSFAAYDLAEVQREFVNVENGVSTAKIAVGGISCAACAWLIEHQLQKVEGVEVIRVNATTRQALVRWQNDFVKLSELFSILAAIGYAPAPAQNQDLQLSRQKEYHHFLLRLGVAGIGMMQVGMVAVALYAGGEQSIGENWQALLRWVSLIVATPVVFFSAQPFFKSAIRVLKQRHLNMDVPVSLALALAYGASCWATLQNTGEVYFDSVSMFTFFLLLGRFLEMRARHSSAFESENLMQLLPLTVSRLQQDKIKEVPLSAIAENDQLWIGAGDVVPADGRLESEYASIDESLLTGESELRNKYKGDAVVAGTHNGDTGFAMRVTATGKNTQLAAIDRMVEQAELEKPRQVSLADKIAGRFVAAVLIVAISVGGFWWWHDPSQALWVVLSILVVTCPCALSLATPAALTSGTNRCRKFGLLILAGHVLETLTKVTHVIFDKTGTLTYGELKLSEIQLLKESPHPPVNIIAALEAHSRHPIATAFKKEIANNELMSQLNAEQVRVFGGEGVEGVVDGIKYRFGKKSFCEQLFFTQRPEENKKTLNYPGEGLWQMLANNDGPIAWIKLTDQLRHSAADAVAALLKSHKKIALLSGDRQETVDKIAETLHIDTRVANATPQSKLTWVNQLQKQGAVALMVGDGINDVPVLSAADVSIAMGAATQLAQTRADAVLLTGDLSVLPKAVTLANRVQKTIRQNLYWAIGYNLLALPAAAAGVIPPWLAAIGMSLSSLIVVLNAMRI